MVTLTIVYVHLFQKLATGDVEVVASDIEILNTARKDLPFQIQDFHKVSHHPIIPKNIHMR